MDISDFEGWLQRTAYGMTGLDNHDDLVQEGRVAIWKALQRADLSDPGLPGYVTMAAKGRMIDVATGNRPLTGHLAPTERPGTSPRGQEARGKIRAFLAMNPGASGADIARGTGLSPATVSVQRKQLGIDYEIGTPTSLEEALDNDEDATAEQTLLDMIIEAYMHGQIAQALCVLTPNERRYVDLRFWEGLGAAELKKAFGYDPASVWVSARERLRPVLEELLSA